MASRLLSLLPLSASEIKDSSPNLIYLRSTLGHDALGCSSATSTLLRSLASPPFLRLRGRKPLVAATATVSMLPSNPDKTGPNTNAKWAARAIKSFALGELEARKLKYPTTGTEALLMGILVEGTSLAAKFLRQNGITVLKVREETINLLGKSDMYFFSPEHPPLTEPAQRAVDWAIEEKLKSGEGGEVTTSHLLLGIWSEETSAGHKILESFKFDNEKAAELAKTANQDFELKYR